MKKKEVNSARVPVYRDSGFELYDADTTARVFKEETDHEREPLNYIYSRYRNPTVVAAEEELMKLEKCEWALLTQSGMSAVDTALSLFQRGKETRPWLFFTEIYGGTISYIESVLKKRRGLDIHSFNPVSETYDLNEFEKVMKVLRPELVYAETISNPLLIVADIEDIVKISGKYGARVIVDNTFATPYLFRPLNSGADLVIHSATKYFSAICCHLMMLTGCQPRLKLLISGLTVSVKMQPVLPDGLMRFLLSKRYGSPVLRSMRPIKKL